MPFEQKSTPETEHIVNVIHNFRQNLCAFVGGGRRYTVEDFSDKTGINQDSIRRWLRGENCPVWYHIVTLVNVLGPEFGNAILQPARVTGLRRVGGDCTHAETLREIAEAAAVLAAALADGRIDHTERPTVTKELREALVAIAQWLAKEANP